MSNFKNYMAGLWSDVKSYFNVRNDIEPQQDIEASIRSGVSFQGSQLLILIFAIFIASLGLNTDSFPVVIGAMLISPLMGPIIGIGLAIGIEDFALLKRSLKNISAAVLGSLAASALYFLISPQYEDASQLLARTSPSIYDVFVGFFGGAAGIVSIAAKNKGQVMPGVAIATSLMPPLCTAGYGLATMQMHFFLGALYLFFTNMIFILFASWIGVKLLKFKKKVYQDDKRAHRIQATVWVIVACTVGVSIFLTVQMFRTNIFIAKATEFVENDMVFPNTQVLNHKEYVDDGKRYIDVTLIGAALPKDSLQLAMMNKLDSVGLGGTILNIKQGFSLEGYDKDQSADQFYELMTKQISANQATIDSLRSVLALHKQFSDESVRVSPEVKVLFPTVHDLALSQMVASSVTTPATDTVNMIFVNAPQGLSVSDRKKLVEYMEVRLKRHNIHLTVNPSNFPWPSVAPQPNQRKPAAVNGHK